MKGDFLLVGFKISVYFFCLLDYVILSHIIGVIFSTFTQLHVKGDLVS